MPYEIKFNGKPAGISVSAAREGEKAQILADAFVSTEDGQLFIDFLEQIVQPVLNLIQAQHGVFTAASAVQSILVLVSDDNSAIAYLNEELGLGSTCISARVLDAGERIGPDDISSFEEIKFKEIVIPADKAVIFLFSLGWRKGLYFDFRPICTKHFGEQQSIDRSKQFAELHNRVVFQNRFAITEDDWKLLFDAGVFPFYGLRQSLFTELLSHLKAGWPLEELGDKLHEDITGKVGDWLNSWAKIELFAPHMQALSSAVERYKSGDFFSSISTCVPRIEGILRGHLSLHDPLSKVSQETLSKMAEDENKSYDILLTAKFSHYLHEVFFASFDGKKPPGDREHVLSRNALAHGVLSESHFNSYRASICMLVVHQLSKSVTPPALPATADS